MGLRSWVSRKLYKLADRLDERTALRVDDYARITIEGRLPPYAVPAGKTVLVNNGLNDVWVTGPAFVIGAVYGRDVELKAVPQAYEPVQQTRPTDGVYGFDERIGF